MTTFTTGGSAVTFTTSGSAVSFAVTDATNAFTTSAVLTPGAHASTHGAGGADPITTLGAVAHSGQQTFAAGSAAGPSIAFSGDTNTGIYSPGADQVGIATAGTARVRVDSAGNVGINGSPQVLASDFTALTVENTTGASLSLRGSSINQARITAASSTFYIYVDNGSSTLAERVNINSAGLITGTGTSLGAWTAYTPTLGGTGWAIGDGTSVGAYCQIGKLVFWRIIVTFGSTSTFGSALLTLSLPVTGKSGGMNKYAGAGVFTDASAGKTYLAQPRYQNTTTLDIYSINSTVGEHAAVISTVPFTWQTSDTIVCNGVYEAN